MPKRSHSLSYRHQTNTAPIIIIPCHLLVICICLLQGFVLKSNSFTIQSTVHLPSFYHNIDRRSQTSSSCTSSSSRSSSSCRTTSTLIIGHDENRAFRSRSTTGRMHVPTHLFQSMETKDETSSSPPPDNDDSLSDLDARVLQSLLEDKDLDLKSEENLIKMLKNNQKKKENSGKDNVGSANSKDDSKYSSTFLKTVTDNSLWNNFKTQADNVIESTKIFIQNRIERDAKLLASISIFAWDKVVKDVARALPSAGSSSSSQNNVAEVVKKTLLALSSNSSYMEKTYPFLLPSEIENTNVTRTVYDELSTPRDDLRQLSESIRGMLSGKPTNSNNNNMNQRRSLRSIAPAGTTRNAERQRLAFERKKETVLKREREGIDKKALRAASSMTDAAWEIKREMEVEGNEAGYRSEATIKRLKASIASSALLEGGKNWIGKTLSAGKSNSDIKTTTPQLESSGSVDTVDNDPTVIKSNFEKVDGGEKVNLPPNNMGSERLQEQKETYIDAVVTEPELTQPEFTEATFVEVGRALTEPTLSIVSEPGINNDAFNTTYTDIDVQPAIGDITGTDLNAERHRIISILQLYLEKPDQTWLRPDLLSYDKIVNDGEQSQKSTSESFFASSNDIVEEEDPWEKVITNMVSAKSELEVSMEFNGIEGTISKDEVVAELFVMQNIVDAIAISVEAAAGQAAAHYVRKELLGETLINLNTQQSNQVPTAPLSDATMAKDATTFDARLDNDRTEEIFSQQVEYNSYTEDFSDPQERVVIADVMQSDEPSPATTFIAKSHETILADVEYEVTKVDEIKDDTHSEFNDDYLLAANVELVIDDDEVESVKEPNTMSSAAIGDEDVNVSEQKEFFLATLTLRTLDVLFFITEKTFTVGIPGTINTFQQIEKKTERINRKGLGVAGWEVLDNVNNGKNRY